MVDFASVLLLRKVSSAESQFRCWKVKCSGTVGKEKKKKKNGQDLSIVAVLFVGRNRREEIVKNSPALGETKI